MERFRFVSVSFSFRFRFVFIDQKTPLPLYINLWLVIFPLRAPPSQIYLWALTLALAFFVTSSYLRLYVAFTCNNMIIKRNLKNLYLLYELGSVVHVLFVYFRKSEPVHIQFEIVEVNKIIFRSYMH